MYTSKKYRSRILLIGITQILIILYNLAAFGQSNWYQSSTFCDGEWLKYKVKWGFIRLGTVEVLQNKLNLSRAEFYRVSMHAKSVNLPFINVFFVNEGILDPYRPTLLDFFVRIGKEGKTISSFTCKPNSKKVIMKEEQSGEIIRMDSLNFTGDLYDALGVFMMMRCLAASGFNVSLNSIIEYKIAPTHFYFTGEIDTVKVAAFKNGISAMKFSGQADWVGKSWGGVSGPFMGWISQDACAIPLKVKIKIFLGSIQLELEEFKRDSNLQHN